MFKITSTIRAVFSLSPQQLEETPTSLDAAKCKGVPGRSSSSIRCDTKHSYQQRCVRFGSTLVIEQHHMKLSLDDIAPLSWCSCPLNSLLLQVQASETNT
jgi:hypothetical protein